MAAGGRGGADSASRREAGAGQGSRFRALIARADPALHYQGRLQPGGRKTSVVHPRRRTRRLASAPGPRLAERDPGRPPCPAGCSNFGKLDDGRHLRPSIGHERRRTRDDSEVLSVSQRIIGLHATIPSWPTLWEVLAGTEARYKILNRKELRLNRTSPCQGVSHSELHSREMNYYYVDKESEL